jgi:hypothetical protein
MGSGLLFLLTASAATEPSAFNQQPFNNLACLVFRLPHTDSGRKITINPAILRTFAPSNFR